MSPVSDPTGAPDDPTQEGLRPGAVIQGKYHVERIIGRGGMCDVGAATHITLGHLVALKVLRCSLSHSQEAVLRFLREARSAAHLKSEHAAHVYDVSVLDSGEPFMVMEYLEGLDLEAMLAAGGPSRTVDAVEYILQACEALSEAHAAGIIHRDLKPGNLFLSRRPDGEPLLKVLDFGIATAMLGLGSDPQTGASLTRRSTTFGTLPYMAPEQLCDARNVDERTDIYALGVTLYELISGRLPYEANSGAELYALILKQGATPLDQIHPRIPAELDRVVARCLASKPEDRYANLAELVTALVPFGPARSAHYAERVSRILRHRLQPIALETQPAVVDSMLHAVSRPGAGASRVKSDVVPADAGVAVSHAAPLRKSRSSGFGAVVAAAAAVLMGLASASGDMVDSRAVGSVQTSPATSADSASGSVQATAQESVCTALVPAAAAEGEPSSPASDEAVATAPRKRPANRGRAFDPYAERK